MSQITITIPTDALTQQFGDDAILNIAKDNGYQPMVKNPDYEPAQGSLKIKDPEWVQPEDFDEMSDEYPMIDNPEYVPAVGEPHIANKQTPENYLAQIGSKIMLAEILKKTVIRVENQAKAQATQAIRQALQETKDNVDIT